jgi:hypothetical protein
MRVKALLRIGVLAAVLCIANRSMGHAVSDAGTCYTYCYDQNGNLVSHYQTQPIDFDYCCGNQDSLCGTSSYRSHWVALYYIGQGDC